MNSLLAMSFRVSVATLRASPFRTFLSTLGIIIGVASLVAVLSLGDGMQQFVRRQVSETTDLQAIGEYFESLAPVRNELLKKKHEQEHEHEHEHER